MTGLEHVLGVAKPIVETAAKLFEKLVGKPCEIAGEMLADQLYLWQWQQRIRIFHRAERVMEKEGIAARKIRIGFLIPLLDAAGNIDNDELQELWSNLIASAAESEEACESCFVETLKGLAPREARLLRLIAGEKVMAVSVRPTNTEPYEYAALEKEKMALMGFATSDLFWATAIRLQGIGVLVLEPIGEKSIRSVAKSASGFPVNSEIAVATMIRISFSRYGATFFARVSREPVSQASISDPWTAVNDARQMAIEAGQAATKAITADEVENRIDRNFGERITMIG